MVMTFRLEKKFLTFFGGTVGLILRDADWGDSESDNREKLLWDSWDDKDEVDVEKLVDSQFVHNQEKD